MFVLASSNAFIHSYLSSDGFGKGIFLALFCLSLLSWTLILYKAWLFAKVKQRTKEFKEQFDASNILELQLRSKNHGPFEVPHPFFEAYKALKGKTLQIIERNYQFSPDAEVSLCEADLGLIDAELFSTIGSQLKILEKNLHLLSTVVTLAPFLGLLGTVWGILMTFSEIHTRGIAISNASMLSGLSMALTTTVIGLLIAIPSIIGYSYFKSFVRDYRKEMENFSQSILATIELKYRRSAHAQKISISN